MKIKKWLITGLLTFAALFTVQAQTNSIPFGLSGSTNWAAIPYGIYRTDTKELGFGGALLYKVTDNFWAGVRADNISGQQTTAGVQLQLQATVTYLGMEITPFLEASTGMGKSSLYASAGPGAVISFHTWHPRIGNHEVALSVGAAGDYEHVVNGSESWQQVCGGPLLRLSF